MTFAQIPNAGTPHDIVVIGPRLDATALVAEVKNDPGSRPTLSGHRTSLATCTTNQ